MAGNSAVVRPDPGSTDGATRVDQSDGPSSVDPENILVRGPEAARARRIDLVGGAKPEDLEAVGPWAEQIDDLRETARAAGFQQGRQEGLAAGLEAAKAKIEEQQASLGQAVQSAIAQLNARAEEMGQNLAAQVTDLAVEIAKAVLDREVVTAEDPGADAIARCLDLVPDTGALVVRLHPDDAEGLGPVPGGHDQFTVSDTGHGA
ncbi:MAG: FliH/SctL family protein, partial [Actinomycetota bacterium]